MSRIRRTPADEPYLLVRTLAAEFADGHTVAPHAHPWGQLIYAVSGVTSVSTAHGSWVVPPHWAVWAPPGIAHALRFTGAASLRTLYLRPDVASPAPTSVVVTVSLLLRELILRTVQIGMLDARQRTHVAMVDLMVHEFSTLPTHALDLPLPRSEWLRRVAQHLTERPSDETSHVVLARRFGIGVRTLERGFVEETGLSLGRWRRHARLMHALRQLAAGASVKRVAAETGYRSPSAFVAAFRAALETTPGRYFNDDRSQNENTS
jgi:AraC-like DNA-binding protein